MCQKVGGWMGRQAGRQARMQARKEKGLMVRDVENMCRV